MNWSYGEIGTKEIMTAIGRCCQLTKCAYKGDVCGKTATHGCKPVEILEVETDASTQKGKRYSKKAHKPMHRSRVLSAYSSGFAAGA